MTLKEACDIGLECGCRTVGEVLLNVEIHATSLFKMDDLVDELIELMEDAEDYGDDVLIEEVFRG